MRNAGPHSWDEARRMARESADNTTDEEDAAIAAAALRDPDNPPWHGHKFRPVAEVRPELIGRFRGRHRPQKTKPG